MINGMKFNELNCQFLHLVWNNARYKYESGEEWLESSPAERNLGCRATAGSMWVSSGQQPGGQSPSWDHQTQHCQPLKRGDCPNVFRIQPHLQHWVEFWAPPFKDVKVLWCISSGQQSWRKGWKECPVRSSWESEVCLVWRKWDWGVISLLSKASWGRKVEREVLSSSP